MHDNEIPRGARSRAYRFFEMLPALLSLGVPLTAIVISIIDLRVGILFILLFIGVTIVRGIRGGVDAIRGYRRLRTAEGVDWAGLLARTELDVLAARLGAAGASGRSAAGEGTGMPEPYASRHDGFLAELAVRPHAFPLPSEVLHAVIVAAYNEPYEVIEPSIRSLADSSLDGERLIVVFAHEQRGGPEMKRTAERLEREFGSRFLGFLSVEHPAGRPDEIQGKGANITWGARALQRDLAARGIDPDRVLVTTLDCDNRVHPSYFESVSYEYVIDPERDRRSFQPISTFVNNVWHAPAPTRVVAAGNTLWNLISTVRPVSLRNFASHTQPMSALIAMDFWSRRTIVEDGHQYWRSYFHFDGDYRVTPIHLPISQDAVLGDGLARTLRAQFTQLCRWSYGASDVAFVGVRVFDRSSRAPFAATAARFLMLLDSHVTLASVAPMVAIGSWIPAGVAALWAGGPSPLTLLFSGAHELSIMRVFSPRGVISAFGIPTLGDRIAAQHIPAVSAVDLAASLPEIVGAVQRVALVGVLITIVLTLLLTPERPERVPRRRGLGMLAQWVLLPVTLLCYNTMSAITSQTRLLLGAYREEFAVTEKHAPERFERSAGSAGPAAAIARPQTLPR